MENTRQESFRFTCLQLDFNLKLKHKLQPELEPARMSRYVCCLHMQVATVLVVNFLLCITQCDVIPFTNGEIEVIRRYFESNINCNGTDAYPGCVIASTSDSNPDMLYHFSQDAAIAMQTLIKTASNVTTFDIPFQNYVDWVLHIQS